MTIELSCCAWLWQSGEVISCAASTSQYPCAHPCITVTGMILSTHHPYRSVVPAVSGAQVPLRLEVCLCIQCALQIYKCNVCFPGRALCMYADTTTGGGWRDTVSTRPRNALSLCMVCVQHSRVTAETLWSLACVMPCHCACFTMSSIQDVRAST